MARRGAVVTVGEVVSRAQPPRAAVANTRATARNCRCQSIFRLLHTEERTRATAPGNAWRRGSHQLTNPASNFDLGAGNLNPLGSRRKKDVGESGGMRGRTGDPGAWPPGPARA